MVNEMTVGKVTIRDEQLETCRKMRDLRTRLQQLEDKVSQIEAILDTMAVDLADLSGELT